MLQFVILKNADTYEKVKETCLEHADNQKVITSQIQEKQVTDQEQDSSTTKGKEIFHSDTSEKFDILCEKFELLGLIVSKDNQKKNVLDITCPKCKKSSHYASKCQ